MANHFDPDHWMEDRELDLLLHCSTTVSFKKSAEQGLGGRNNFLLLTAAAAAAAAPLDAARAAAVVCAEARFGFPISKMWKPDPKCLFRGHPRIPKMILVEKYVADNKTPSQIASKTKAQISAAACPCNIFFPELKEPAAWPVSPRPGG